MTMISCSLWSADLARLADSAAQVQDMADAFHFDVMDGHFVRNFLFGPDTIRALRGQIQAPFLVHLMVERPAGYLEMFVAAGADYLIVHPETCQDLAATVREIKNLGARPGVALVPGMPIEAILPVLSELELVVVLCVAPGYRNQPFVPSVLGKIRKLRELAESTGSPALFEADGAIRDQTVPELIEAGTDILCCGSIVFRQPDPRAAIGRLKGLPPAPRASLARRR